MIITYHISGDWGCPSASIVCRFSRNLWERYTVLAEVEFCPLGASLFPSHQAQYFCSLVVQGIASVLAKISVGVIGAKLLSSYVSQHSIFRNCNAEIPSLLEKFSLLCSKFTKMIFEVMFVLKSGITSLTFSRQCYIINLTSCTTVLKGVSS